MESFNSYFNPNYSFSEITSLNNSYNTSANDIFGDVNLSTCPKRNRRSSFSLSPPWGQRNVKNLGKNVSFQIQPIGTIASQNNGVFGRNVLLCTLTPVVLENNRDQIRYQTNKIRRIQVVRNKRKAAIGRMSIISDHKQRQLKRLQRKPWLKLKKQEVYGKWEKKQLRRDFQSRKKSNVRYVTQFACSSVIPTSILTSREEIQSPSTFQCPLWHCKRRSRISRREEYERRRKTQPSRLSCRSDKSRSPIIIRSSQGF